MAAQKKPLYPYPKKQIQKHHLAILQTIDAFLSEYLLNTNSPRNTGFDRKALRSDTSAVVLSGDASNKGFEHLKGTEVSFLRSE